MIKTENLTILFVDIAGFTVTTSRQSRVENARLLQTFGSTLLPLIKGYKGRLIKTIGDALLITFRSPTDAMLCSMSLQDAMHAHNLSAPDEDKIHIRVAANLGEVRVTKNDIFGEPVNVASRIEGVAPADEIYLSEAVYMAMNKAEVPAREVGTKELAGVAQPVRLYNIPRFSTHRLVAESTSAEEQGSELLYPYGGMHCQPRSKNLPNLLQMPDTRRLSRLLVFGAAVCIIALGAALGYQHFSKRTSVSPVTLQSAQDKAGETMTTVMPEKAATEATAPAEAQVRETIVPEKEVAASKDVPEKETPKPALSQDKAATAKPASGTLAQEARDVKEEPVPSTQAPETKVVKEEISSSTWTTEPEAQEVKEEIASGTWAPEPEVQVVKEEIVSGTWSPEPEVKEVEEVKEKYASGTWYPETEDVKGETTEGTLPPETQTDKEDLTNWDLRKAKLALNADEISRVEYKTIVKALETRYDQKIRLLKQELRAGNITRSEYDEAVRKAKLELKGS